MKTTYHTLIRKGSATIMYQEETYEQLHKKFTSLLRGNAENVNFFDFALIGFSRKSGKFDTSKLEKYDTYVVVGTLQQLATLYDDNGVLFNNTQQGQKQ